MDAWACREGTPEDDEDERKRARTVSKPCGENRVGGGGVSRVRSSLCQTAAHSLTFRSVEVVVSVAALQ